MKYGTDMSNAVNDLKLQTYALPEEPKVIPPATVLSFGQTELYKKVIAEYYKKTTEMDENIGKLYAIVWGQCSDSLREKVKALTGYNIMMQNGAGVDLLIAIRDIAYKRKQDKDPWVTWHEATFNLYEFKQENLSNDVYFQKFQGLVDVVEHCGGSLGNVRTLQQEMLKMIAVDPDIIQLDPKSKSRFQDNHVLSPSGQYPIRPTTP